MQRVLISGASGLVGSALVGLLKTRNCEVKRLVRREPSTNEELRWDPMHPIASKVVSGFDWVIHLSGENVAGRWTAAKKRSIRDSRVISTQNLSQALAEAPAKPAAFTCASAIGYYGDGGDEALNEQRASGKGFLAEVSRAWEDATRPAASAGIRTANLRIGLVLSRNGGALKQMLLPFRMGLGGRIGSGRQWWSWIHIDDLISAVWHVLATPSLAGAVNMTAPNPVTNEDFTRTLGGVLKRQTLVRIPALIARLAFGELADEGILASIRVEPEKLLGAGFEFRFPTLESALRDVVSSG
jgi:uncharacterized protein